ncbi:MAG: CapA family protein [Chloroflexota bacterium]|nr:CapA family protein [Chloroflexota bacterium]
MRLGRVYLWTPDSSVSLGGHVRAAIVPLERLDPEHEGAGLHGRYVRVRNGGAVNAPDETTGEARPVPMGDAQPDANGDFLFEPGRGGGRLDKVILADAAMRWRAIQAAHFGEVNTYYHLDRIAAYVDELLRELGAQSLPRVVAVVNAHHAATEIEGVRDGIWRHERWLPFQGGHYRLPSRRYEPDERAPISPDGEIHLGPGWRLVEHGALVEAAGSRYRANASHNAGIAYHEYGHHITRHTADFRANALRRPHRQNNLKIAMDEGTSDYWAATMLDTPHIWAWHRRHDAQEVHPRSLVSPKTMADYDARSGADAHANGTIWAAALWDLRSQLRATEPAGARMADLLILQALVLLGQLVDPQEEPGVSGIRRARKPFTAGLAALLQADAHLYGGRHHDAIGACFSRRGISLPLDAAPAQPAYVWSPGADAREERQAAQMREVLKYSAAEDIPASEDILSGDALEALLVERGEPDFSLMAGGDIMLGGRTAPLIASLGSDYPLAGTRPLLRRAPVVLGNLEGPFARKARSVERTYSYRVNPALASALTRAGVNALTLANNHLLDCGRAGVEETLETLTQAGITAVGAGVNTRAAHTPAILPAGRWRIGLLGYYWNSRCAARDDLPGSAMDTAEDLEADIHALRQQVDRVVVTFHWGVPYEREPHPDDRAKARLAVDCGADAVIGHHPHVAQPFEIYRGAPIFYSVGNWAFGSGNSKAEGLLVGLTFGERRTRVSVYPLYVKNRDPRVNYQPKVLAGEAAARALRRLASMSGASGACLTIEEERGWFETPWPGASCGA